MRVLLQRVSRAAVRVDGQVAGAIEKGFVALVGVTHGDSQVEVDWLAHKVAGLRVFEDNEGKMNLALSDVGGGVLVISQFTLYGDAGRGRRPSFTDAASPDVAEPLVDRFAARLRDRGLHVESGVFGAHMEVEIHNDGPVTMMIEKDGS